MDEFDKRNAGLSRALKFLHLPSLSLAMERMAARSADGDRLVLNLFERKEKGLPLRLFYKPNDE
jgi:hypothetical protein